MIPTFSEPYNLVLGCIVAIGGLGCGFLVAMNDVADAKRVGALILSLVLGNIVGTQKPKVKVLAQVNTPAEVTATVHPTN